MHLTSGVKQHIDMNQDKNFEQGMKKVSQETLKEVFDDLTPEQKKAAMEKAAEHLAKAKRDALEQDKVARIQKRNRINNAKNKRRNKNKSAKQSRKRNR